MKTQTQFKNASLVSVVNGTIVVKSAAGIEHTFTNASVVSVNNGTIIIESEWEPKVGELIKLTGCNTNCYCIYRRHEADRIYAYGFKKIGDSTLHTKIDDLSWCTVGVIVSPVTPEEAVAFDNFCKDQGKLWNKEKLQWEKYGWIPKQGKSYFYVLSSTSGIRVCHTFWANDAGDYILWDTHNCFRTEKQAERAAEKVKELFKSL